MKGLRGSLESKIQKALQHELRGDITHTEAPRVEFNDRASYFCGHLSKEGSNGEVLQCRCV